MDMYETIENKVKEFAIKEFEQAVLYAETAEDVLKCRAIAYGAIQFAVNNLFPTYNKKLAEWWDKCWNEFNKLMVDKKNNI